MKTSAIRSHGFTIVELLVVIVVIGVIAAITIVAYNGMQTRSDNAKISSDLNMLKKAIMAARLSSDKPLWQMTGGRSGGDGLITADECGRLANGTDFATLAQTHACWVKYNDTLSVISAASSMDVRSLKDPYGRPYFIYENEDRATDPCTRDQISIFSRPHTMWGFDWGKMQYIPNSLSQC